MRRGARYASSAAAAIAAGLLLTLPACKSNGDAVEAPPAIVRTIPPAGYSTIAARYNERIGRIETLRATAVVRIKYVDDRGKDQEDQGEGLLQVVRPDRLALSIKKAGKMLFWFGGDAQRYWLFDVVDKPVVRVGRHELIGRRKADATGLGLDINPRELISLLGITPLPIVVPAAAQKAPAGTQIVDPGVTRWSADGRFIEVSAFLPTGAKQVLQLDPETYLPRSITLLDLRGNPAVTAIHEAYEPVEIANFGGGRPQLASRIVATHPASKTEIKLDLGGMRNSNVSPSAFNFDELRKALAVDQVIDLDAPPPAPPKNAGEPAPRKPARTPSSAR